MYKPKQHFRVFCVIGSIALAMFLPPLGRQLWKVPDTALVRKLVKFYFMFRSLAKAPFFIALVFLVLFCILTISCILPPLHAKEGAILANKFWRFRLPFIAYSLSERLAAIVRLPPLVAVPVYKPLSLSKV